MSTTTTTNETRSAKAQGVKHQELNKKMMQPTTNALSLCNEPNKKSLFPQLLRDIEGETENGKVVLVEAHPRRGTIHPTFAWQF